MTTPHASLITINFFIRCYHFYFVVKFFIIGKRDEIMLQIMKLPKTSEAKLTYTDQSVDLETFNMCPNCGKEISPKFIHASFTYTSLTSDLQHVIDTSIVNALYECPSCHNGILVKYKPACSTKHNGYGQFVITKWESFIKEKIFPSPEAQFPFDDIIISVSPKFKDIYTQSLQAKLENKNELVGIGYRKSIEFLVKDYLIHIDHPDKDKIPTMQLGDCIKRIDNQKILALAKASTWLGNDETHYSRKHTDKDINDLERFLNSLVVYISFELTAAEAISFINK